MTSLPLFLAQDTPPDRIAVAREQFEASWHPHSYFELLGSVGPFYAAANALMFLGFVVAAILIFRKVSPGILTLWMVSPLICGAIAMLIHERRLTFDVELDFMSLLSHGHSRPVNILRELWFIPFPFYLGAALTAGLTLLVLLRRLKLRSGA